MLGPERGSVRDRPAPATRRVRFAVNERSLEGQSTSLRAGLRPLGPEAEAAVILLGDQPGISPEAIDAVIAAPDAPRGGGGRPGLVRRAAGPPHAVAPPGLGRGRSRGRPGARDGHRAPSRVAGRWSRWAATRPATSTRRRTTSGSSRVRKALSGERASHSTQLDPANRTLQRHWKLAVSRSFTTRNPSMNEQSLHAANDFLRVASATTQPGDFLDRPPTDIGKDAGLPNPLAVARRSPRACRPAPAGGRGRQVPPARRPTRSSPVSPSRSPGRPASGRAASGAGRERRRTAGPIAARRTRDLGRALVDRIIELGREAGEAVAAVRPPPPRRQGEPRGPHRGRAAGAAACSSGSKELEHKLEMAEANLRTVLAAARGRGATAGPSDNEMEALLRILKTPGDGGSRTDDADHGARRRGARGPTMNRARAAAREQDASRPSPRPTWRRAAAPTPSDRRSTTGTCGSAACATSWHAEAGSRRLPRRPRVDGQRGLRLVHAHGREPRSPTIMQARFERTGWTIERRPHAPADGRAELGDLLVATPGRGTARRWQAASCWSATWTRCSPKEPPAERPFRRATDRAHRARASPT